MQPIPPVDPVQHKDVTLTRDGGGSRNAAGHAGSSSKVVRHFEPTMIRASGGKLQFGSGPRVNVTAPGRRSGELRTATLLYFTRGDEVILIASNFGGEHFPAWYYNVKAAGEAELQWRGGSGMYIGARGR